MANDKIRGRAFTPGITLLFVIAVAGVLAGYFLRPVIRHGMGWQNSNKDESAEMGTGTGTGAGHAGQIWTCGMHPQVIQRSAGICPICRMELTPATSQSAAAGSGGAAMESGRAGPAVTIDPVVVQNMGVRVATVTEGPVARSIRAAAVVIEPEQNHIDINLRVSGWVEKLYANVEGMRIEKGAPLFDLQSPSLSGSMEDLIAARHAPGFSESDRTSAPSADGKRSAYANARRKLERAGIDPADIRAIEEMPDAPTAVVFRSPITGHVASKMIFDGSVVEAGHTVMRLASTETMWVDGRVPEQDLPMVRVGQKVTVQVAALPGRVYEGVVTFIHPHLDPAARAALVRSEIANADQKLLEQMSATMIIQAEITERSLLVPREAIIDTGVRQIAIVVAGASTFEPRLVTTGVAAGDGMTQVLSGLSAGEVVVTSGQFLIDSESRMKEAIDKFLRADLYKSPIDDEASRREERDRAESFNLKLRQITALAALDQDADASRALDAVVIEYLKLAELLGAPETSPAPIDVHAFNIATIELVSFCSEPLWALYAFASDVNRCGQAFRDKKRGEQRESFKALSDAMIALVRAAPPTKSVAPKLYVAYCSMAPGRWLQASETIENPYYATEMKSCGVIEETIESRPALTTETQKTHPRKARQ